MTGLPVPVGVEFFNSLPVVPSNNAGTPSVEEAGHTTSQEPHEITISPLPSSEVELIVLIFVPETRASCLPFHVFFSVVVVNLFVVLVSLISSASRTTTPV